jgi:hypothetical protein
MSHLSSPSPGSRLACINGFLTHVTQQLPPVPWSRKCLPLVTISMKHPSSTIFFSGQSLRNASVLSDMTAAKFGQILKRTDTRLVFCNRKSMRTDIFFTRTTHRHLFLVVSRYIFFYQKQLPCGTTN